MKGMQNGFDMDASGLHDEHVGENKEKILLNHTCNIEIRMCNVFIIYFNMPSFFRFVNKRASYPFGINSLAHAPVNVTDFSIGSINCNPNNNDRDRSIIQVT